MAGRRKRREKKKVSKGVLLVLFLTVGLTMTTPLTPTLDASLASVAAAAAPVAPQTEEQTQPKAWADFADGPFGPAASGGDAESETGSETTFKADAEEEKETDSLPKTRADGENVSAEDSYFADAAFVGDSRTEGFQLYSGLSEGTYFCAVGATVQTVMDKETQEGASGPETILDALSRESYGKIYIMLGINELGWYRTEEFTEQYAKVIARIREDHPEATIVIQSLPPVSAKQDAKRSYVKNERIVLFNGLLKELAAAENCVFLDVASAVTDESGTLPRELTTDGVHLNTAGCKKWLKYLQEHPV